MKLTKLLFLMDGSQTCVETWKFTFNMLITLSMLAYYLLKYPLTGAPAGTASTHFSGYINIK